MPWRRTDRSGPTSTWRHDPPPLDHLGHDVGEKFDVAKNHPGVVTEITKIAEAHRKSVKPVENQLMKQ